MLRSRNLLTRCHQKDDASAKLAGTLSRQQQPTLIHINRVRGFQSTLWCDRSCRVPSFLHQHVRARILLVAKPKGIQMISIVRIAVPACSLFASGWLLRDPMSVPLWQIGLGLVLASIGVAWIFLHQS